MMEVLAVAAVTAVFVVAGWLLERSRARFDRQTVHMLIQTVENERVRTMKEREQTTRERHLLLERIQRPEYNPGVPSETERAEPNEINDELHLVGQIVTPNVPPDTGEE